MRYFKIVNNELRAEPLYKNPFNSSQRWGIKLGGKWCVDYTFKLCFGVSDEDWESKWNDIKTSKQLFQLFDKIKVAYKDETGVMHNEGEWFELYN